MLPLAHLTMTALRRILKIHAAAHNDPHRHKPLIAGHTLELAALALGAFGFTLAEHVTGVAGAALLLYHVLTEEV